MLRGVPVTKSISTQIIVNWYGKPTKLTLHTNDESGIIDSSKTKIKIHSRHRYHQQIQEQPPKYYDTNNLLSIIKQKLNSLDSSSSCILVNGPSGSGKSALLDAILSLHVPTRTFHANRVAHELEGDSELYLSKMLEPPLTLTNNNNNTKSIIICDDIDVLAANRDDSKATALSRTLCGQFIRTLKRILTSSKNILVVMTTKNSSRLDRECLALFEMKLQIPSLDLKQRKEILTIFTRDMPLKINNNNKKNLIDRVSNLTSGFRPADLLNLCRESAYCSIRRGDRLVGLEDFRQALRIVRPNLLSIATGQEEHEDEDEENKVGEINLPGLVPQKELLTTCVMYPLIMSSRLPGGMSPPRGIIVYGKTGTGKTRLCKELGRALRGRAQFISVSCPSLLSKIVGQTEKNISQLFHRARSLAPSVLFLDHIESLAPRRGNDNTTERTMDRLLSTLLLEMDGVTSSSGHVVVLGVTSRLELLDPAILRPGRLEVKIQTDESPCLEDRVEIFKYYLKSLHLEKEKKISIQKLGKLSEHMNGGDIEAVCRDAAMLALRTGKRGISESDLVKLIGCSS